ncbi:small GTPase superfamily [Lipomyces arxii]|uniref:small GTPase superfamily n=1 Tax=Lipomyces arxii TaxID=56418 RepID=UPI0034CFCF1E
MDSRMQKVAIIGDGAIGKTCFLTVYCNGVFPQSYLPTIFDATKKDVSFQGKLLTLYIQDTAGQEEYARLRLIAYNDLDAAIVGFSIGTPESLDNVYDAWWPEISNYTPTKTPFVLVGMKSDLRNDPKTIVELRSSNQTPVTEAQGQSVANRIGAYQYVECSALQNSNLEAVFQALASAIFARQKKQKKHKHKKCAIL